MIIGDFFEQSFTYIYNAHFSFSESILKELVFISMQ